MQQRVAALSAGQLIGDGVGEGVADIKVRRTVVETGSVDGIVRNRQRYAGAVVEAMRPRVRSEKLQVMPELLLEFEL